MTTIAGFKDTAGNVAIAGDRVFNNGIIRYDGIEKIHLFGEIVAGFSGPSHSHRFRGSYEPTQIENFTDDFRAFQMDAGHSRLSVDMKETASTAIAVTQPYQGAWWRNARVYLISNDGGMMEVDRYIACGSGAEVAFGAFNANVSLWPDITADLAVKLAIQASAKHDAWTGDLITIWSNVGRRRIEALSEEEIAGLRLPTFRTRKARSPRVSRIDSEATSADASEDHMGENNKKIDTGHNDSKTTGKVAEVKIGESNTLDHDDLARESDGAGAEPSTSSPSERGETRKS